MLCAAADTGAALLGDIGLEGAERGNNA